MSGKHILIFNRNLNEGKCQTGSRLVVRISLPFQAGVVLFRLFGFLTAHVVLLTSVFIFAICTDYS